jgi:AcrR family transcriptional regulator
MTASPTFDLLAHGADDQLDPYAERILEAARRQLARYGLRRTSLEDIAHHAGVGRATLYRRFPNRDALLTALIAREATGLIAHVDEHVAPHQTPQDRVVHGFLAFIHGLRDNDLLRNLATSDPEQILPLLTSSASLTLGRQYISAQAARAQAQGAELTATPDQIAEVLARLAQSLALTPDSILPLDDDEQLTEFARATLTPLVFKHPTPRSPRGRRSAPTTVPLDDMSPT